MIFGSFAKQLRRYGEVFVYSEDNGGHVALNSKLKTAEERTRAVGEVIKCLGEEEVIPGIRNEVLLLLMITLSKM